MATFFKHSFVVIIIKHDLEIRKAQSIFSRLLDVNIETLYVGDLNECVRFFGFVARRVTLCNRSKSQSGGGLDRGEEEDDENTNNLDSSLTAYLEDSRRIMEIVACCPLLSTASGSTCANMGLSVRLRMGTLAHSRSENRWAYSVLND